MRTLVLVSLLASVVAAAQEKGPIGENGKPVWADFAHFSRDMELACYGVELSGAQGLPPDQQADAFSQWLAAQGLGEDFSAVWRAVGSAEGGANKSRVFLAAAAEANIGRCPWGEDYFQSAAVELRSRCARKDEKVCAMIPDFEKDVDDFIRQLTADVNAECKKGRKLQCALPAQLEKMRLDMRSGTPAPKAPPRLWKGKKPAAAR